jgi:uncharacterized protein
LKPEDVETWRRALLRFRQEKDEFFGEDHESPLGQVGQQSFHDLNYFDPEPALRFEIELRRSQSPRSVIMATSKGTRQLFNDVGYFELPFGDKAVQVHAYQSAERDDPHLFVPFRDSTSGSESYGAARYLDLDVQHDDKYAVDFNYAYNPYCAYSDDYVCPLPPKENWLDVAIRAGEKKYRD